MKAFISVSVDLTVHVGYVRYQAVENGDIVRSRRESDGLVVDYLQDGAIAGVELLDLSDRGVEQARAFAGRHALAFPRDLTGAVAQA